MPNDIMFLWIYNKNDPSLQRNKIIRVALPHKGINDKNMTNLDLQVTMFPWIFDKVFPTYDIPLILL